MNGRNLDWKNVKINKDAEDYEPDCGELGMTADEAYDMALDEPTKYEAICQRWRTDRLNAKMRSAKKKEQRQSVKLTVHWYLQLSESEVLALALGLNDEANNHIDKVLQSETLLGKINYYAALKERIKCTMPKRNPASPDKLKVFPKYDMISGKLFGNSRYMVNFLAHVYSPKY